MSALACYHLDTRLTGFAATAALDGGADPIALIAFEVPDDIGRAVAVSLVSHSPGFRAGDEFGWRRDPGAASGLDQRREAAPGERLVLAVALPALRRAVAAHRAAIESEGDAAIEIGFSTVIETGQGAKASPRRGLKVTVLAGASQPGWRIEPVEADLDRAAAGRPLPIGRIALTVPADIALEGRRGVVIEAGCAGLKAQDLSLAAEPGLAHAVVLRRQPDAGAATSRHLLWLADAAALAGQTVTLDLLAAREAMLDAVEDGLESGGALPSLRLTARLGGWAGQDGALSAEAGPGRRWSSPQESRLVPLRNEAVGEAELIVAGQRVPCRPEGGAGTETLAEPLLAEVDPDDETGIVRCRGLELAVRRWPLLRTAPLLVAVTATLPGGGEVAEPEAQLPLELSREGDLGRRGRLTVPMQALTAALSRLVRDNGATALRDSVAVSLRIAAADRPQETVARVSLALAFMRRIHRLPICIDLGASATSIWSGAPRPEGAATDIRPLALGSWLARHVDPGHDEAAVEEGGFSPLIPSHVGLDSANHLRADHAPHTLPDLDLVGADRAAVARRLEAYGRRYDVSAPAPPARDGRGQQGRRIESLKRALTSGAVMLTLDEPVNRYDAASGRVVATNTVEVAPLVADVLDELIDLYLLRLGDDGLRIEDLAPAPVVPRILVSCPSGVGDEIASRYRAALELFVQRLERLYPGVSTLPDAAATVPESVAASRYLSSLPEVRGLVPEGGEALLVTLDIGGGTSDVALAHLARSGGRLSGGALATFGLPVGGEQIDEALVELVARQADLALAVQPGWRPLFGEVSLLRACGRRDVAALSARAWLRGAVQKAKATLSAGLAARAEATGGPYRWDGGETLDIVLAEWREGAWRGLYRRDGAPALAPAEAASAPGVELAVEGGEAGGTLLLRLARAAIEGGDDPAARRLAELSAVLGGLLPRMARAAAPNPTRRPLSLLVPTGRAALWPPLFEAVAAEAESAGAVFPFPRPFAPAAMKKAVIAGAAILGIEGDLAGGSVAYANPLGIAAMAVEMRDLGEGGLRTAFAAERIHYLGYDMGSANRRHAEHDPAAPSLGGRADLGRRFHFVRTVPGLDPQGRVLARLRPLLSGADPAILLEGDSIVEAHREGLDAFGRCEIVSEVLSPTSRKVTIIAADEGWEACWRIDGERVSRIY